MEGGGGSVYSLCSLPDAVYSMSTLPDAIENTTVGVDAQVHIGQNDVMEVTQLLVLEEKVRHPHLVRLRQGQVLYPTWGLRTVSCMVTLDAGQIFHST